MPLDIVEKYLLHPAISTSPCHFFGSVQTDRKWFALNKDSTINHCTAAGPDSATRSEENPSHRARTRQEVLAPDNGLASFYCATAKLAGSRSKQKAHVQGI